MSQMTPSQARAVDPLLTAVARGYRSQDAAVADVLFPIVPVGARAGNIINFGPDDFKIASTVRAPGTNTKRVQFGYSKDPFALVDHRLEALVPNEIQEEGMSTGGIDNIAIHIRKVQNVMALERENQAATLARNAANYGSNNKDTLTSTARWDDPASNPFTAITAAKESVRGQIGRRPNVLVCGPKVLTALRNHAKVMDRLSTATDRPPATLAQLAALFELDAVVEGSAIYHTGTAFADVWGTDAILAYTTPASMADMGSPSYGYTYQLQNRPVVEEGYADDNTNSMVYPVADARKAVLAGASAGFVFKTAVS